ncbi:MAG: hypothetical protein R3C99_17040 [Pirellulaceae bacterium]
MDSTTQDVTHAPSTDGYRFLSGSMYVGALVDWVAAANFFSHWSPPAAGDNLPQTTTLFYLHLVGLFLVLMGIMYFLVARDARRHLPFAKLAVAGRVAGAIYYVVYWNAFSQPLFTVCLIGLNMCLAAAHAYGILKPGKRA